jgi:allantoin racemase
MTIVLINPNSTVAMTTAMVAQAERAAPGLDFEGWTSSEGPPAIQGAQDGKAATPPLLELVKQAAAARASGIVIGCFDDTALAQAARLAECPVVGIGQVSYHYAALQQKRFSVVTTLSASVPVLEKNIKSHGLTGHLSKVRASEVPVLELETDPARTGRIILEEAQKAEAEDDIAAVILGCAGMVQVAEEVRRALTIETIDPVVCAARAMAWVCAR